MTTEAEPTPRARCDRARELVATDAEAAFRELRPVLAYPAAPDGDLLRDALDLMRAVSKKIAGDQLADLLAWTRDHTDDPEALYDAAYAFYEQRLHDLAAALLARANGILPGSTTIVTELSANLEALIRHAEAAEVVRASGLADTDPMCGYLLGYNALMSGDVETARPIAARMRDLTDGTLVYMGAALSGMVARADAIRGAARLDDHDLAGWHLVVNGTALLHLSPHGYDAPMRGRYAYVIDSEARIREGLDRLAAALAAAGITPPRVLALPDRSSTIVALAAARILGVPCEPFPAAGDAQPGVVVAYDLDRVGSSDALERLRDHRPGQVLFAHASCWTDPFPYAPDVTTYLYEINVAPWDAGRMRVDPETRQVVPSAEDTAPAEEISERIVTATGDHESVSPLAEVTALVAAARRLEGDAAAGLFRTGGQRLRQRAGSAVRSNRFG